MESDGIVNVSQCFHSEYQKLIQERLYIDEKIVHAADCTATSLRSNSSMPGFIVFTDRRYLLWYVYSWPGGVQYYGDKPKGCLASMLAGDDGERRSWYDTTRRDSLPNYQKDIMEDEYAALRGIVANEYSVVIDTRKVELRELRFDYKETRGSWYVVFKKSDGIEVQKILSNVV
ncbi:MAG: hypothetical protein J5I90_21250 [Caldilineales bacterium]|nr:hypothetical protein [Caldilineales bacterium]